MNRSLGVLDRSGRRRPGSGRVCAVLLLVALACVVLRPGTGAAQSSGTLHTLTGTDSGAMINIPVGDSVELRLDTGFNWNVTVSDTSVLRRPPVLLVREVQGLWNAVAPGTATINGTGTKACPPQTACPALAVAFNATVRVTAAGGSSVSVSYAAGWNLVGTPSGTVLPVDAYAWDQAGAVYVPTPAGTPLVDGRGYWAYFDEPTMVTFASASRSSVPVVAPPGRWVLVGNPGTRTATVTGADLAYTRDAVQGVYVAGTSLARGAGAWVLSSAGGTITVQVGP